MSSRLEELPRERTPRGPGGLKSLGGLFAQILPPSTVAQLEAPAAARDRVAQLDATTRELEQLLRAGAPDTWQEIRRPFWRLLRRARRDLRRADRERPLS